MKVLAQTLARRMKLAYVIVTLSLLSLSSASALDKLDTSSLTPKNRNSMVTAVVGAGGATGLECVKRLLSEGHTVKAVRFSSLFLRC